MTKKTFILGLFLCHVFVLTLVTAAHAVKTQNNFPKPGVRPIAMGGAFVAVADDVNSIYYNPAGLGFVTNNQVQIMHTDLYGIGIDYNYLAFAKQKMGIAWAHFGVGPDFLMGGGDFSSDMFIVATAFPLDPQTNVGASVKWMKGRYTAPGGINPDLFENGIIAESLNDEGFSIDVGVLHKVDDMTRVGVAVRDLFGKRETVNSLRSTEGDQFEPRVVLGFARKTSPDFMFAVELDGITDETIVRVGAEKKIQDELMLRAGLDDDVFTAGFSYQQSGWEFEYAFKNSMSAGLDKTQRYGATYRF